MIRALDLRCTRTRRAVLGVSLDAYRHEAELLGLSEFPPLGETLEDLNGNLHLFWGHDQEGELSGVIELNVSPDLVEICRLVVKPAKFRLGIGSALVQAAIDLGQALQVMTAQANVPAIKLSERHGFQIVHVDERRVVGLPLVTLKRPASIAKGT